MHLLQDMRTEHNRLRDIDAARHPATIAMLRANGNPRPHVTLQSILNDVYERKQTDRMEEVLKGTGVVMSLEHDGIVMLNDLKVTGFQAKLVQKCEGLNVKIKSNRSLEAIMKDFSDQHPGHNWDLVEEGWEDSLKSWLEARRRHARGEKGWDMLLAELLPSHPFKEGRVGDVFKVVADSKEASVVFYCKKACRWMQGDTARGKAVLGAVASDCLKAAVCVPGEDVPSWGKKGPAMRAVVESCTLTLYDLAFASELNGESTRPWVMFNDGVAYNHETEQVAALGPNLLVSHACGIPYPAEELAKLELLDGGRFEAALWDIHAQEAFFGMEYREGNDLTTGSKDKLQAFASSYLPLLATLSNTHGSGDAVSWHMTLYLLKHKARQCSFVCVILFFVVVKNK